MSRWICIDNICIPSDENDWDELVAFADAVAEQEPIDLVRCRECRYRNKNCGMGEHKWCEKLNMSTTPDDFCSYGKRKESK